MFNKFTFLNQMEENIRTSLIYPFHIKYKELIGNDFYNEEYPDTFHCHSFEEVLNKAYREPKAFYLSEEDKKYYSEQEIDFISKVIEFETENVNNNKVLLDLNLSEETIEYIEKYKLDNNMTFEEAINDILHKIIEANQSK